MPSLPVTQESVPVSASASPRFSLASPEDASQMLEYLSLHGYAVIAAAASPAEVDRARDDFWRYCEQPRIGRGGESIVDFSRNDCTTWHDWLGHSDTGIIASPRFNHSDFCWNTRLLPLVKKTFSSIWNTEELIVSFDAGNAFRPWTINPEWTTARNWWHVDQNSRKGPERQGRVCVQGLVTYYDVTEESGGLCLIPGTHLEHDELCARCPSASNMHDYVYIESSDPILTSKPAILPLAKAGDLIIWDSRTVHCNTPGLQAPINQPGNRIKVPREEWIKNIPSDNKVDLLRLVSYVCMVPRALASREVLDAKKKGFMCSVPTSHWPTEKIVFFNEDEMKEISDRPDEMLRLAGFTEKEIAKKRYDRSRCNVC